MPEILIAVSNKIPVVVGDTKCIIADNSDYIVRFSFDGQWQDGEKTVYFVRDNGFAYPPVQTENDAVPVPRQESGGINKRLYIGVTQGESRTTRPAGINVLSSITDMIDDDAVQPDPSLWEDIVSRIIALEESGGSAGEGGAVYVLEEGESLDDVPEEYDLAYDPYAEDDAEEDGPVIEGGGSNAPGAGGYVTLEQLEDAVNDALEKAKASGEFKGDPGDDYILTDADKTEIAQEAVGLIDTALLSIIGEVTE